MHYLIAAIAVAIVFDAGFVFGTGWKSAHNVYRCPFCGHQFDQEV